MDKGKDNIHGIMDAACVQLKLSARTKESAVEELVLLLAGVGKLSGGADRVDRYVSEVMGREKISSTGIGNGIAIPHILVAGVSAIMMAVGRSARGVPFDSVDGKPAHLIFLIVGPQGQNSEYLKILSRLSRYLNDRGFFDALMKVSEPAEAIELIKERER
jgi:mannitol/fructose-specific phosphotransferase system IIA component (Ntr-type)